MLHAIILFLTLLATTAASAAESPPPVTRFSGSTSLIAPPQQSADQRYSIMAKLKANTTQRTGRFALTARLLADAKTSQGVCGMAGDPIFADGFEN